MENRTRLFVCHTPYHVLISIIKTLVEKVPAELMICNSNYVNDTVIAQIKVHKIFNKLYVFDDIDERHRRWLRRWDHIGHLLSNENIDKCINKVIIKMLMPKYILTNKLLYIFNDAYLVGDAINFYSLEHTLVEDALDFFCLDENLKMEFYTKERRWGKSPFTKFIEINSSQNLVYSIWDRLLEVPRKELFEKLTEEDKKTIINIYFDNVKTDIFNFSAETSLLLTQPFYDSSMITYEEHAALYKELVKNHCCGARIIIKKHPIDTVDYTKIIEGCFVIEEKYIPVEVLNLLKWEVKEIVTVNSTAINGLYIECKKTSLGYDWYEQFIGDLRKCVQ